MSSHLDRPPASSVLRVDGQRFRVGSWRGDPTSGYLAHLTPAATVTLDGLRAAADRLRAEGFRVAYTAALAEQEARTFRRAGFDVHEELHLLRHNLELLPDAAAGASRRARRRDRTAILEVDNQAFEPFWRLDREALDEAQRATPVARTRVVDDDAGRPVAYAVTGKSGGQGYLQRLAVRPGAQRGGIGRRLVADSLRWLRRRRATSALVNTQVTNERARRLYESMGYVRIGSGLSVLRLDLER